MRRATVGQPLAQVSRFAKLAKAFEDSGLGQAADTLREVRAVPTIFCQLDQMLGVGGWPTDRFGLVHGESNGGKTELAIGLILSFLMQDHSGLLVDAERTTPPSWLRKLMGRYLEHPGFRVLYPDSYESTVDAVRAWAEAIGDAKAHGRIDADTTGIAVVDSLRKLAPKRLLERLLKEAADGGDEEKGGGRRKGPRGVDGMGGRAAQYKAALNAQWVDELTPLLFQTGTCLVAIARETEGEDKQGMTSFDNFDDFKVGGGQAIYFESSVVLRVTERAEERNDAKLTIATQHALQLRKTKVAEKLVRRPTANFWTSTGISTPYGFDRARDLLELGTQLGSIDQAGANYMLGEERIGNGKEAALKAMAINPELFARVDAATRTLFMPKEGEAGAAPVAINRKKFAPAAAKKKKAAKKRGRK